MTRPETKSSLSRRHLLKSAAVLAAGQAFGPLRAADPGTANPLKGRLYKTLKIGMIGVEGSLTDKFNAAKEAGFLGVEMNAPGMDIAATKKAILESGLPVDGTVCADHWGVRHTDPKPEVRAQALATLKQALIDTHEVGGHSVLLVVGRGGDGPEEEIWKRSVENISQAVPLAAKLGVSIAIENVWNQFLYKHEGGSDQNAEKFVRYVDEFKSPWVGMQFDIGNHWKYGSMGDWIRALGKRVLKLDVKGFNRAENKWADIGEGDLDFADVRAALTEIGFNGWCAAEVGGGKLDRLKVVSQQMDRVFLL
ncbi:MAG: sugar phosphate isomerase/epimerase family protein [Verrucomicrobiales bacterium]|nr:sugar phosphate isomerase/epimerase [Verrucomicrobiales bacterium]